MAGRMNRLDHPAPQFDVLLFSDRFADKTGRRRMQMPRWYKPPSLR